MLWPLDCFVARAPRNDGSGADDPIDKGEPRRFLAEAVARCAAGAPGDAFRLLLCHRPEGFIPASAHGFHLTLSGHTHGGQLMLGEDLGVGPMLYRYWSGHYLRANSQLIVSNGVGNWFPLRVDAPAEIVHLTLRRA